MFGFSNNDIDFFGILHQAILILEIRISKVEQLCLVRFIAGYKLFVGYLNRLDFPVRSVVSSIVIRVGIVWTPIIKLVQDVAVVLA